MADEKLNTGPAENTSPEAAEPIATPEQAAASEPRQEQTGPATPEPGDVVVSFDKINELICSSCGRSSSWERPTGWRRGTILHISSSGWARRLARPLRTLPPALSRWIGLLVL